MQPIPERQGDGHPEQEPRDIRVDQVRLAVKPGHEQERAGHDQAHRGPVPAGQEGEADRDRQGELETEAIRRAGDVLHPRPEDRMGRQVQLAGEGWMKVDAVPAVGPVVEESHGIDQPADLGPRPGMGELLPPLLRQILSQMRGKIQGVTTFSSD